MSFTPIPVNVAYQMVKQKTAVKSKKVRYNGQLLQLTAFEMEESDLVRVSRIGADSALYIGPFPQGASTVKLFARSLPLADIKRIVKAHPYILVLAVAKGTNSDTGSPKFKVATSLAFKNLDDFDKLKLRLVKTYATVKAQRDSQKTKLYSWEGKFLLSLTRKDSGWKRVPETKLLTLADKVVEHFKVSPDRVHINSAPTQSAKRLGVCQIFRDDLASEKPAFAVVNVHDSTIDTLIHELAHIVVGFVLQKPGTQAHGPEFCGVYAHMFGLFGAFSEDEVIESMTDFGLKVKRFALPTKTVKTEKLIK